MVTPESRPVVEHSRVNPVFVLGQTRSGTSLTCRLLLDHLGINFGTESQFIARVHQRLDGYGDLRDDRRLRQLFEDIAKERFFERTRHNFGFCLDIDRAMRSLEERTYAGVVRAIFGQFANSQGLVRWGDKTPEYNRHLPLLRRLFPDAQYVHVIRDGRNVAVSMRKTGFGAKTALEAATEWMQCVERIQRFGRELPPDQFLEIRYEDLVAEPACTMERVAEFLGVIGHVTVIAALRKRLRAQVRPGAADVRTGGRSGAARARLFRGYRRRPAGGPRVPTPLSGSTAAHRSRGNHVVAFARHLPAAPQPPVLGRQLVQAAPSGSICEPSDSRTRAVVTGVRIFPRGPSRSTPAT
jgi:hypothetical protein